MLKPGSHPLGIKINRDHTDISLSFVRSSLSCTLALCLHEWRDINSSSHSWTCVRDLSWYDPMCPSLVQECTGMLNRGFTYMIDLWRGYSCWPRVKERTSSRRRWNLWFSRGLKGKRFKFSWGFSVVLHLFIFSLTKFGFLSLKGDWKNIVLGF